MGDDGKKRRWIRLIVSDDVKDLWTDEVVWEADGSNPLQRFLLFLNLYAETVDGLEELHPGCLVASIVYQDQVFDREIQRLNSEAVIRWRARFLGWLEAIDEKYEPVLPIDREALADGLSAVVEGSIILAKALDDRALMGRQIRLFRDMVKTAYGVA